MSVLNSVPGGLKQAKRVVIPAALAALWLDGQLVIGPPNERIKRANGNGNGALSDDAIKHFVIEAGVDRVRRAIERLEQPTLPLATEVVS